MIAPTAEADVLAEYDEVRGERPNAAQKVLAALKGKYQLLRDEHGTAYAQFEVQGHREIWPVASPHFSNAIQYLYYHEKKIPLTESVLLQIQKHLAALAKFEGEQVELHEWIAEKNGKLYLDLCDDRWRVIEITDSDWRVLKRAPVKFYRSAESRALPVPSKKGSLARFRRLFPQLSDAQWTLIVTYMLMVLCPNCPYPILMVNGLHGSGKSTLVKLLRRILFPSTAPLKSLTNRPEDLWAIAYNDKLPTFDNVSSISDVISDELCKLTTGASYSRRKHYEHEKTANITLIRSIILNGIAIYTPRHDLLDRTIALEIEPLASGQGKTEQEIIQEFESILPEVMGALCKALQSYLRHKDDSYPVEGVRMKDAILFAQRCAPGIGMNPSELLAEYKENRRETMMRALDGEPLYQAIHSFLQTNSVWEGTASELLTELRVIAPFRQKAFPQTANSLAIQLKRLTPFLTEAGILVTKSRTPDRVLLRAFLL